MPQTAVLLPSLFSLFTHDIPRPTIPSVKSYTYADALTIVLQRPLVNKATIQRQSYLNQLENYLTTNRTSTEGSQFSFIVITPFAKILATIHTQVCGSVFYDSTDKNILDVTIDFVWIFRQHSQANSRLNAMKALFSTLFEH